MSKRAPIIRQTAWPMVIPQLVFLVVAIFIAVSLTEMPSVGLILGAGATLAYSFGARALLAGAHQRGMRLIRQGRYAEAVEAFQASYDFFSRHPWVDRLRAFILMMASPASYREMALLNAAFCYGQMGKWGRAREVYERVIEEFGDTSGIAARTLRVLDAAERVQKKA